MNAESQMIKQVIANVTEAGYKIVSIISDNNVIIGRVHPTGWIRDIETFHHKPT